MKNFTKIFLVIALVLILIGGTICVIGAVNGGFQVAREFGREKNLWKDIEYPNVVFEVNGVTQDWNENAKETGRVAAEDYTDTGVPKSDVSDLKIEIGGAALYLLESEDDHFGIKQEGVGKYWCYESHGTLNVSGNRKTTVRAEEEKVYLYIPKGMKWDNIEISVGGGVIEAGELTAEEVDLEAGAGVITIEGLSCQQIKADIGAGKATLKGIEAEKMELMVGVGHAYAEGDITKDIQIECGMGAIELALAGGEADYNYDVDCTAGNVMVGDRSFSVLTDERKIDNDANAECRLECAMGSIQVKFER